MKTKLNALSVGCFVALVAGLFTTESVLAQSSAATPEIAVENLKTALQTPGTDGLDALFGPKAREILSSGDPVTDQWNREVVTVALGQRCEIAGTGDARELIIGNEQWPFPVPLLKGPDGWYFDVVAGADEIFARRIGRNELFVIEACRTYVSAQHEYAEVGHDGNPAGTFAQKFRSQPGKQDGLYWDAQPGEDASPLGAFFASATLEGYAAADGNQQTPFRGYYFRILNAQGAKANGGAMDYVKDGRMSGGFGLIAVPAEYGNSGIMSFIVNQDGVVYESDLGPDTAAIAAETTTFNPTRKWSAIQR